MGYARVSIVLLSLNISARDAEYSYLHLSCSFALRKKDFRALDEQGIIDDIWTGFGHAIIQRSRRVLIQSEQAPGSRRVPRGSRS